MNVGLELLASTFDTSLIKKKQKEDNSSLLATTVHELLFQMSVNIVEIWLGAPGLSL